MTEYPKVKFTNIPLSTEVDLMYDFLFQNKWGWGKYIIKKHPKIKKVFSLKNEQEQVIFLKRYISGFKKANLKMIERNKKRYENEWRKIENDFLEILSEIIEIDWPNNKKTIKAMVSINPICPRFLSNWSFSIFFNYKKISDAMEVIMHECCHFLYFEKWKEIFPYAKKTTFEYPHIEWHLSEILAPVILNDPKIQKILREKAAFYKEYQNLIIHQQKAPKYFELLYKEYRNKKYTFGAFLKKAYSEIKKNEKVFLK